MLNLTTHLARLAAAGKPIRVGIIGAGQMGTGLVSQIARMQGMRVVAVADISLDRAAAAFRKAGLPLGTVRVVASAANANLEPGIATAIVAGAAEARELADAAIAAGQVVALDQANWLTSLATVDVVVEATGYPEIGARVAEMAIAGRKHVVMLNAETDATVGFVLKRQAEAAGVIYTGAAGDEPAATKELYDFSVGLGFEVLVAGKGKNNPVRLDATPTDLAAEAAKKGTSPKMLTSFVDGTKTMVEMTQLANATGLVPDCRGMHGPAAKVDEVLDALRLQPDGGALSRYGVVEYINGIAPGVFVVIQSDQQVVTDTLRYLKMGDGPRFLLYRPYHLTSLETPISVARAVIYGEPTIVPGDRPVADTVTVAKRDLVPGDVLDGLGGATIYGTIVTAGECQQMQALPLGLAVPGTKMVRPVAKGSIVTYADVAIPEGQTIVRLRQEQDRLFYGEDVTVA